MLNSNKRKVAVKKSPNVCRGEAHAAALPLAVSRVRA
jgi:hypothetical protein